MKGLNIIHEAVCNHYKLGLEEIFTKTRKRRITEPRQVMFYLFKEYFFKAVSLTEMGRYPLEYGTEFWDHVTVLHSHKTIVNLMNTDRNFKEEIKGLKEDVILALSATGFDLTRLNVINQVKRTETVEGLVEYLSKVVQELEKEIEVQDEEILKAV